MVPDWQTNRVYVSHLLPKRHPGVWEGLKAAFTANGITVRQLRGTKDLWVRDFSPIQVGVNHFVKFRYEPDYLKGHEDLLTDTSEFRSVPQLRDAINSTINLDGGNVVAAETKVILTDKVFKENPEIRRPLLRKKLQDLFKADTVFIPKEPFDPIGHADGLVRFINENTVLVNDYSAIDKEFGRRLRAIFTRH
jgi:agmatine deiminase